MPRITKKLLVSKPCTLGPPTSFQIGGCLGPACFWLGRQQSCHYPRLHWFCWVVAVVCFFFWFWWSKHLQDQPIWAWWFNNLMILYPKATKKLEAPRKLGDFEGRGGWPQADEFLKFGRLHPWTFNVWNLSYGAKTLYFETLEPSVSFYSLYYRVNVIDVNRSI